MEKAIETINRVMMPKVVDFILNKRLCQKCASKKWKNRKEKTVTQTLGICGNCGKGGMVAYINTESC